MDLDDLLSAYWEHYTLAQGVREDRLRAEDLFWAWEAIHSLAHGETNNEFWADPGAQQALESAVQRGKTGGSTPLAVIVRMAHFAPDEEALGHLGAGPLEDYLAYGHPDLSGVEEAAKHNPRFRVALRGAWFDNRLNAEDVARLRKLVPRQ